MSLISQYAGGRSQLPFVSANLAVSNGGATTVARTLYFCLQAENPVGHTLPSTILGPYTINVGQQLTLTLTSTVRNAGESWLAYTLSASTTNTPSSFTQLARIPCYDTSNNLVSLPVSLTLSTDEAFKLSQTVANVSALPLSSLIAGMRRGVFDLGYVFEYDPTSILDANDLSVLEADSSPGRWLRVGGFTNFLDDVTEPGGAAQDIRLINELVVKYPRYACDGNDGRAVGFWLKNTSTSPIPSGQRVLITVLMNEAVRSGTFEGLLRATFKGYVNTNDGTLRTTNADSTTMRGLNTPILFENKKTDLVFEDDLQPGESYWLELLPNLIPAYLNYGVPNKALIEIYCTIAAQAGAFVEGGDATGNKIYPKFDRGVAVPIRGAGVRLLKRSGMVNSRGFLAIAPTNVSPLVLNTAAQQIRINGNGAVYLGTGSILDTEATRAVVDLLPGISNPSPLSTSVFVESGQGVQVTLTYPSNGTRATIRTNYPDLLLAGNTQAELNALFVTVYIKSGAVLKRFSSLLLVDGATQTFDISDWNAGVVIDTLPSAPNPKFCLFEAVSASAIATTTGNFPDGLVQVAYAFQYDGSTVSAISHARTDGCLHTSTLTQADIEDSVQFWGIPVATFGALPTMGSIIGQIIATLDDGTLYRWTGMVWEPVTSRRYWGEPVANFAALPTTGSIVGQIIATLDDGTLYRWTGMVWEPVTSRRYWGEPVATVAALPTGALTGQVRLTLDTGRLYRFDGSLWQLAAGASSGGGLGILNVWRITA